jgi:hypothetical protein
MQTATTAGQVQPLAASPQPSAAQSAFLWLAPLMMPLGSSAGLISVVAGDSISHIGGTLAPTHWQRIGTPHLMKALRPVVSRLGLRSSTARRSKPLRKRNTTARPSRETLAAFAWEIML